MSVSLCCCTCCIYRKTYLSGVCLKDIPEKTNFESGEKEASSGIPLLF